MDYPVMFRKFLEIQAKTMQYRSCCAVYILK